MHYRMIAIDLDGTLLNSRGRVSKLNLEAIAAAQAAGLLVVPCTGRAWCEASGPLTPISDLSLGVFVTGAVVTDTLTGQSLDLAVIEPHLAKQVVDYLYDLPEAVLVFQEASLAGRDYLVTGNGKLTANTQWWFDACGASVHYQAHPALDDLHHTLRVGLVAPEARMRLVTGGLQERFDGQLFTHYFGAVQLRDGSEPMYVMEILAAGVDKWRGLMWIAQEHRIGPASIIAIGDQINDVAMIQNAGCGIAMANSVERVKQAADHITLDNDTPGVAHAINQVLAGAWG